MTSQSESSTTYNPIQEWYEQYRKRNDINDAALYAATRRLQELELESIHAHTQADGTYRQETTTERIERIENMIVALQRKCERQYDFLIGIIEERTLVLSSIDEMYDDYC